MVIPVGSDPALSVKGISKLVKRLLRAVAATGHWPWTLALYKAYGKQKDPEAAPCHEGR